MYATACSRRCFWRWCKLVIGVVFLRRPSIVARAAVLAIPPPQEPFDPRRGLLKRRRAASRGAKIVVAAQCATFSFP